MSAVPDRVHMTLRVNGEDLPVSFAPYKTLLEVLREDLNLTGTKHGCELGECGACAVLVDGEPLLSCLELAVDCEGREIQTVEGLATGTELHPLQRTFIETARRAQIVHAAIATIAEVGYARASLARIGARIGISKGLTEVSRL